MTTNPLAAPGEQFHAIRSLTLTLRRGEGLFDSDSVLLERGQTATITAEMLEAQKDKNGHSLFERLGDPDLPIQPGPWPGGAELWQRPGDPVWHEEREKARRLAFAILDPDERAAALAEIRRRFGNVPTSRTMSQNAESYARADLSRLSGIAKHGDRR